MVGKDEACGPRTLMRGLGILEALHGAGRQGLRITEIVGLTGISRPTVYRFLEALEYSGYVHEMSSHARRFVFNYQRFQKPTLDERHPGRPLKAVLKRISLHTGDSSFLVHRENGISHCIHRETGSYPVQVLAVAIGHRQPLGVGAAGLALLSSLPPDEIDRVLEINRERLPRYGGMTEARMRQLIRMTQERGWSVVGNSAVPGIVGVGVPILHDTGAPLFGVSVSSTLERMSLKRQQERVEIMRKELAALSLDEAKRPSLQGLQRIG